MSLIRISFLAVFIFICAVISVFAQVGGAKGKVRAPNGGGLSGASVTARQEGEDIKIVKTDSKGNFSINGLKPGRYNFVFEKVGYATGVKYDIEIKRDKEIDLGDKLILTIDKGTQIIINGSVFNQKGFGIYGAKIEIEKLSADGKSKKVASGYSGEFGEFTFRFSEGAARYRVTAKAKDAVGSGEVEVSNPAVYRLAITLNQTK